MTDPIQNTRPRKAIHRSPGYPMFSLKDAIDKAKVIYDNDKRTFTTPDVIAKHLGFSQHVGGPGGRSMSALRQYGLLEENGDKARISDLAYTLIQFPVGSLERTRAIKTAIRKPHLFNELLDEFPDGLPSDAALHSNLLKRGFNPEVIGEVIRVLKETVALDTVEYVEYPSIQVGDYVQWELGGAWQFQTPQRVTRFSDDGKFAFFEGSLTGAPVEQLIKDKDKAPEGSEAGGNPTAPLKRGPLKPGINNDIFTLAEGDVALQWPSKMSPESYQDFKDWLELITRKVGRAVDKGGSTSD